MAPTIGQDIVKHCKLENVFGGKSTKPKTSPRNQGLSWSWSYGSWIYNYLCNQCLSPLTLWLRILLRLGVLDTTLCDSLSVTCGRTVFFFRVLRFRCTNITEILLKVALNTIDLNLNQTITSKPIFLEGVLCGCGHITAFIVTCTINANPLEDIQV
jgi:hypothetical protein